MEMLDFNLERTLYNLVRLGLALILAVPIGWERGAKIKKVGFRTFPIVSMASCGFILMAEYFEVKYGISIIGNTIQGMLGGIGFIGGGAIVKQKGNVQGIVTAASIWNTGAIGVSVALGEIEMGIILSLVNFLILYFLTPVAKKGYLHPKGGLFQPMEEKSKKGEEGDKGQKKED